MEIEDNIAARRAYSQNLVVIIDKLGVTVVRHLSRFLEVVVNYLEIFDGPEETCRIGVLDALHAVLNQAWPRIPGHANVIMKALVKFLYDLSTDQTTAPTAVIDRLQRKALGCIDLLRKICPEYDELDEEFFKRVMCQH